MLDAPTQAARPRRDAWCRRTGRYMQQLWRPLWDTHQHRDPRHRDGADHRRCRSPSARRATPRPASLFVRPVALFVIVSSRSINSLIWALMLVTIIGPGVFAGILAIGLRSIGFCAKLLYEAIEEIDESPGRGGARDRRQRRAGDWPMASCRRSCRPSPASRCSAGTSTSANRRCSAWSAPAASACSSNASIIDAGLDAGLADPAGHPRHRHRQRMGVGQGPPRDHLTFCRWKSRQLKIRVPGAVQREMKWSGALQTRDRSMFRM